MRCCASRILTSTTTVLPRELLPDCHRADARGCGRPFCWALLRLVTSSRSGGCHGVCSTRPFCFRLTCRRCSLTDWCLPSAALSSGVSSLPSGGRNEGGMKYPQSHESLSPG